MTEQKKKAKARAAWRAWYRRHREKAKAYYRERYAKKIEAETPAARKKRLRRAREVQRNYVSRKKNPKGTKNVRDSGSRRNSR